MYSISKMSSRIAALCIAIAFAGQLARFWWVQLTIKPVTEQNFYAIDDVMSIVDSYLWVLIGIAHLATAVALAVLGLRESDSVGGAELRRSAGRMTATIASGLFLILGMAHVVGAAQIRTLTGFCAEDGYTVLAAYNLLRTVLLGSSLFAFGAYLLVDAICERRSGDSRKLLRIAGLTAAGLCWIFVFLYSVAPSFLTTLTLMAVIVWALLQALSRPGNRSYEAGQAS